MLSILGLEDLNNNWPILLKSVRLYKNIVFNKPKNSVIAEIVIARADLTTDLDKSIILKCCDKSYTFYKFYPWTNTEISLFVSDQRETGEINSRHLADLNLGSPTKSGENRRHNYIQKSYKIRICVINQERKAPNFSRSQVKNINLLFEIFIIKN